MEVHTHTHTAQKKWTHYLWEFLMLFLAVFCGFLAENQREHMVEHRREKESMVSLVKDLELDSAQFSKIKMYRIGKLRSIDSVILFFVIHPGGSVPVDGYTLAKKLFGHAAFFQNSGTLDQLKNAGGLRLIRHRNVVDSIESYDQQVKRITLRDMYETDFFIADNKLLEQLFDGRTLLKIYANATYNKTPASTPAVINLNEQYLGEYLNSLRTFQFLVQQNMDLQASARAKAVRLITLIKKEYHLD